MSAAPTCGARLSPRRGGVRAGYSGWALRRQARQAVTPAEQRAIQQHLQKLEKQKRRRRRQDIFKAEDEILEKCDSLIEWV